MKTKLNKVRFLTILMLLCVLQVNAINVKRVSQGDVLNRKANSAITMMYIIEGDCSLSGDVELAAGSILKFEGGTIDAMPDTSFTIRGSNLIIEAPKYQIFGDSINVTGIANSEVSAHWWGAVGDGESENYFFLGN